jgi:hypothetical protein
LDPSQVLGIVVAAHHQDGRRCWPGPFARGQAFLWIIRYHALRGPRYLRRQIRGY